MLARTTFHLLFSLLYAANMVQQVPPLPPSASQQALLPFFFATRVVTNGNEQEA